MPVLLKQSFDRFRRLRASTALKDYLEWTRHAQVLELCRVVTDKRTAVTRQEVVYGITSLGTERASAAQLLRLCGAENIAAACRRYAARPALAHGAVGIRRLE